MGIAKSTLSALFLALILLLGGCASKQDADVRRTVRQYAATTAEVNIIGMITQSTAESVVRTLNENPNVTSIVLRIDSQGGYGPAALQIAMVLEQKDTSIIASGRCNSACAQYILPAADHVTLAPGTEVVVHASEIFWISQLLEADLTIDQETVRLAKAELAFYRRRSIDLSILDCAGRLTMPFGPIEEVSLAEIDPERGMQTAIRRRTRFGGLMLSQSQFRQFLGPLIETTGSETLDEVRVDPSIVNNVPCWSQPSESYKNSIEFLDTH